MLILISNKELVVHKLKLEPNNNETGYQNTNVASTPSDLISVNNQINDKNLDLPDLEYDEELSSLVAEGM